MAFSAVYAEGGTCGISPATRSDTSDRQLCFTWCGLPQKMKTIFYMGLRAISKGGEWRPWLVWGSAPYQSLC
eukprot:6213703-Pleurochrysis_carterae.AAC.3